MGIVWETRERRVQRTGDSRRGRETGLRVTVMVYWMTKYCKSFWLWCWRQWFILIALLRFKQNKCSALNIYVLVQKKIYFNRSTSLLRISVAFERIQMYNYQERVSCLRCFENRIDVWLNTPCSWVRSCQCLREYQKGKKNPRLKFVLPSSELLEW